MVVVFHTLFGVAVLSLDYPGLDDLGPVYCTMPASLIERMGLKRSRGARHEDHRTDVSSALSPKSRVPVSSSKCSNMYHKFCVNVLGILPPLGQAEYDMKLPSC